MNSILPVLWIARRLALGDTFFCDNSEADVSVAVPIGWWDMGGNVFGCGAEPTAPDMTSPWTTDDIIDWALGEGGLV